MASVKAALPLLATRRTVDETLVALNEKLCDELEQRQFVALAYARYEAYGGELLLANAGFPDPYLLRRDAKPEPLSVEGPRMPLGYDALAELLPPLGSEPGVWLDELFARVRRMTTSELADDWTALLLERRS